MAMNCGCNHAGYTGSFDWDDYLDEDSEAAPDYLFS